MEIKGPGRSNPAPFAALPNLRPARRVPSRFRSGEVRGSIVAVRDRSRALDSILMLQGMDDSTDGRSKGVAHGEQLLDMLDQIRDGLLAGGIPRATLNRLANAVSRRHDAFADPKLQNVLDEIELRAHVELAKLEMMDKRVA